MERHDPDVTVDIRRNYPSAIDDVARMAEPSHRFLSAAWYAAAQSDAAATIVASRGGRPFAALPTIAHWSGLPLLRAVAGAYWPFRTLAVDREATPGAIAAMVAHPRVRRTLSPAWRIGPVPADDPAVTPLLNAVRQQGWTVLTRRLGTTYRLDLASLSRGGSWPRKSTLRRLRGYEKQLARQGAIRFRHVSGADWNAGVIDELRTVETLSWQGSRGKALDPKFQCPAQQRRWLDAVKEPALANALSATLLYVGDQPIAFSFDLNSGDTQYAIASGYDARFGAYRPGKIVTYHQLEHALSAGIAMVDLGVGDSGYKVEMGAEPGPDILDHLIVRYRTLAALLRRRWENPRAGRAQGRGA